MSIKRHDFTAGAILLKMTMAIALLNGCSSVNIDEYQHIKGNDNYTQKKDSLSVSINPITDSEESKKYFGKDMLSSGVLAVHILMENLSSSDAYLVEKEKIVFEEKGASAIESNGGDEAESRENEKTAINKQTAAFVGTVFVTPLALPLYFSGLSDVRNINAVKHNLITKELRTKILHSGESIHGFVYFGVQTDSLKVNGNRLVIPYAQMATEKQGAFQFDL